MEDLKTENRNIFESLMQHPQIMRSLNAVAFARLGNYHDAEDAVQEAFLNAFRWAGNLIEVRSPFGFMCTCVINAAKRRAARKAKERRSLAKMAEHLSQNPMPDPSIDMINRETLAELEANISQLPDKDRDLIQRLVNGESTTQIALELGYDPSTIRRNRDTAKDRLLQNRNKSLTVWFLSGFVLFFSSKKAMAAATVVGVVLALTFLLNREKLPQPLVHLSLENTESPLESNGTEKAQFLCENFGEKNGFVTWADIDDGTRTLRAFRFKGFLEKEATVKNATLTLPPDSAVLKKIQQSEEVTLAMWVLLEKDPIYERDQATLKKQAGMTLVSLAGSEVGKPRLDNYSITATRIADIEGFSAEARRRNVPLLGYAIKNSTTAFEPEWSASLGKGKWNHLALTVSKNSARYFFNGEPCGKLDLDETRTFEKGGTFVIGGYNGSANYLTGALADIRLYDQIVTPAQIKTIFENPPKILKK